MSHSKYLILIITLSVWTQVMSPLTINASQTAITTLYSTKDSYIVSHASADNNYGTSSIMYVGVSGAGYQYHSLIYFEVNSISVVTQATIQLNMSDFGGTSSALVDKKFYLHQITEAWAETGVTWNTAPTYNATSIGFFSLESGFFFNLPKVYEVDITSVVQDWVSGATTNYGLMIIHESGVTGGRHIIMQTRESNYASALVINDQVISENIGIFAIFPILLVIFLFRYKQRQQI
jgi:hypothetical protein